MTWDSRTGVAGFDTSNSDSCSPVRPTVGIGVGPDPEEQAGADRVQVGRVAGHLQLTRHDGVGRIGEVDHVQRVDLSERDHVPLIAEEADAVDALVDAQAREEADLGELAAGEAQRRDPALPGWRGRVPPQRVGGAGDAQHALVLRERELAEQVADHLARAEEPGARRVGDVEGVQIRA